MISHRLMHFSKIMIWYVNYKGGLDGKGEGLLGNEIHILFHIFLSNQCNKTTYYKVGYTVLVEQL